MKKIAFTNKLYYGFVVVVLIYFLLMNGAVLIQTGHWIALLPLTLQSAVLTLVLLRHQWTSVGIKVFALFFIVGSGLQLAGQLIFLLTDADDKIDYDLIIRKLIMFLIGVVLFAYCDRSVKRVA